MKFKVGDLVVVQMPEREYVNNMMVNSWTGLVGTVRYTTTTLAYVGISDWKGAAVVYDGLDGTPGLRLDESSLRPVRPPRFASVEEAEAWLEAMS